MQKKAIAVKVIPVGFSADVRPHDDLGAIVLEAVEQNGERLRKGDILVVAQKIVSKSEGRVVDLAGVRPSRRAQRLAKEQGKPPRIVEVILGESREVVKARNGIIITETKRHGLVCANAGVDQSNVAGDSAVLLPKDPDRSARALRDYVRKQAGAEVAVIITDTFGRPFRNGQVNVAIGVAGMQPIKNYIGTRDMHGKTLKVTEMAVADEVASAAELVMGKAEGVPVAIVRGYAFEKADKASSRPLVRHKKYDLFRQR